MSVPDSSGSSSTTPTGPRRSHGEKDSEAQGTNSKRRRVPDSVTRNACLNCKKARAKCDGKKPCKRCAARAESSECVYEVHIKHAKEELIRQIKELKSKDAPMEQILQSLSADNKASEIIDRLKQGESYENIADWLGRAPKTSEETSPGSSLAPTFERDSSDHGMTGLISAVPNWTPVISDTSVLDHLFQLYFAWVHPVHTLFSEGHFVDSYKNQSNLYCSSVLVNAICAMACHLHSVSETDDTDYEQLEADFTDAVRMQIDPQDKNITTTQALAVMFLLDCARAKCLRGSFYLELAKKHLTNIDEVSTEGFLTVLKETARGIRSLSVEWAQITFQDPGVVSFEPLGFVGELDQRLDKASWYFYRYTNEKCSSWPGFLATTNREKSKLVEIIYDVLRLMYNEQGGAQITAQRMLQLYGRLIIWHEQLPEAIANIEFNTLPHALSLQILYSTSMVLLLRPLLEFKELPSRIVEEVVRNHAQKGLSLLEEQYHSRYTYRYQPVLQMFSILHLCDTIARYFPNRVDGTSRDGTEVIMCGIEALTQSKIGFTVAGPLQEMLGRTAVECAIPLPRRLDELMPSRLMGQAYGLDDMLDACCRPTYIQPSVKIINRFHSQFSTNWASEADSYGFTVFTAEGSNIRRSGLGAQRLLNIRNLLNSD
ncbi:hypothetical protein F5884DRAFT_678291 [Xylogone sp. PMI_703]|nr:hypothetical protein F5884DRAFT_678291 [Xylogone sp. PMI_703]